MHGRGKSDPVIVAVKPTNKAERSVAEWVEPRAGTKGNVGQLSSRRTQCRISVTQVVGSHTAVYCRRYPRWEPYAGKPHVAATDFNSPEGSIRRHHFVALIGGATIARPPQLLAEHMKHIRTVLP